jgi:hypothetical protein
MSLKVGDSIPGDVKFSYVPYTPESGDITACGIPINYDAGKGKALVSSSTFIPQITTLRFKERVAQAYQLPRTLPLLNLKFSTCQIPRQS